MRPRLIEVTNFIGHEHEQVVLPDHGIFFLSGESGGGKSSFIVDAIGYALFGSKATRYRRQEQLLHTDHPNEAMEVRVLLEFDDGSRITVARGMNARGNPWAELYDSNNPHEMVLLAETAGRVGRIIRQRLGGMTWQQFYAAFVARQSEILMLTQLAGAKRKELVHRLLGMREIEKASEETTTRLRSARAHLKGLQNQLGERTRTSEDEKIQAAQAAYDEARQRSDKAQALLIQLQEQKEAIDLTLLPLKEQMQAYERARHLKMSLSAQASTVEALASAVARHEQALIAAEKAEELTLVVHSLTQEVSHLRAMYARSDQALKQKTGLGVLQASLQELTEQEQAISSSQEGDLAQLKAEQIAAGMQLENTRKEISEREEELIALRETGECFTCLRPLGEGHEHDTILTNVESKIYQLQNTQQDLQENLTHLETTIPAAALLQEKMTQVTNQVALVNSRIEEANKQLQDTLSSGDISDDLEALKSQGQTMASELNETKELLETVKATARGLDVDAAKKHAALLTKISSEESELQELEAKTKGFDPTELVTRQEQLQTLTAQIASGQGQVPEIGRAADSAAQTLEAVTKERAALLDKLDKLDEVTQNVLRLEEMQTFLTGFQRQLAGEIRPALEEMGSEMLGQVSGGKHIAMRIDDSYEIEVQTASGSWLPSAGLSGGENTRVNICLRLALTRLVSQRTGTPVRFLVFDEPLPSQDPGHVQRIMELLDSLRPFYAQQFVISHVGELRAAEQVDYILNFDGSGPDKLAQGVEWRA